MSFTLYVDKYYKNYDGDKVIERYFVNSQSRLMKYKDGAANLGIIIDGTISITFI